MLGTLVDFIETLKSWNSRRCMSSTHSVAALTSASTGLENSRSRRCLGSEPELTPTRSGVPWRLATSMTSAVFSGPPMLPGLMRTQCAPASMRLDRQRVVEVDVGDHGDRRVAHDRLERLDVLLARHGDADDVGARPRRPAGSGPSSGRGSPSRSWSSSGRPRARRPRWGRRPRGSAARRPCPECTSASSRCGRPSDWLAPRMPTSTAPPAGACARAWPLRWPPAPAPAATRASSPSPGWRRGCAWSTSAAGRWGCAASSPT